MKKTPRDLKSKPYFSFYHAGLSGFDGRGENSRSFVVVYFMLSLEENLEIWEAAEGGKMMFCET